MNERFEHLMYSSGLTASGCWDEMDDYAREAIEKFAELIVQECVAICEDTEGDPSADSRWGRRCCALEIRQHFGVEE